MPAPRIRAPFSRAQVAALNAFQRAGHVRHFDASGRVCDREPLATAAGWRCPCGWRQFWAYQFMAAGSAEGESTWKPDPKQA